MTSFNKNKTANTETAVDEAAPIGATLVATQPPSYKIGGVQGEVDRSDIKMPYVAIVQSVGPLSENFEPGQVVLNKEFVVSEPEAPTNLTALNVRVYYVENLPYDGEKQARIFQTMEEVKAAGLHTEWIGDEKPPASKVAEVLVALESATENPLYPHQFGGKHYALASWGLRSSSSFNRAGKILLTAASYSLKDGLHNGSWQLSTRREKLGKNFVWVPVLKAGPRNSTDLASFFAGLL